MEAPPQINFLIPLYNEEEVFDELVSRLTSVMDNSDLSMTVVMVDDGSLDSTSTLMQNLSLKDSRFGSVFLSRNFGHQLALTAGLTLVDACEAVLILDADLQDPPELIGEFYPYLKKGYDVVYAVRKKRKENLVKKFAYKLFYVLLKRISYFDIPLDAGDFALISRRVVNDLNRMPEQSRYLRGMRSWIGYKQIGVEYERAHRHSGDTKYSFKMLLSLAYNGIFNFSTLPVKFIFNIGVLTVLTTLTYLAYVLVKKYYLGDVPEGFTGLISTIILFGGLQLIGLGIIGEYILRIFFQVKNRPLFIIRKYIINQNEENG